MYLILRKKKIWLVVLLSCLCLLSKAQAVLEQVRTKQLDVLNKIKFTPGNQAYGKFLKTDAAGNVFLDAGGPGTIIFPPGSGVDSITDDGYTQCWWSGGISHCRRMNEFFDSTHLSADGKWIYYFNNGVKVDSVPSQVKDLLAGDTCILVRDTLSSTAIAIYFNPKCRSASSNTIIAKSPVQIFTKTGTDPYDSIGLLNATQYQVLGRSAAGTGAASFISGLDSNYIPGFHTQPYYDLRYGGWKLLGNIGNAYNYFLGTLDNNPIRFRVNNTPVVEFDSLGHASIYGIQFWKGRSNGGQHFASIGIGDSALNNNTTGLNNLAFGDSVLTKNQTSSNNIGIGTRVLYNQTAGADNIGIGSSVMTNLLTGFQNVGIGSRALTALTGSNNTFTGFTAGQALTSGIDNTGSGSQVLLALTTGAANSAYGRAAMIASGTAASNNCAFGYGSLYNVTGNNNIAMGNGAGANILSATHNIAIGVNAIGSQNSGVPADGTGIGNIAIGYRTMTYNTAGLNNVAIGYEAGFANTLGIGNVAIGRSALYKQGPVILAYTYVGGTGYVDGSYPNVQLTQSGVSGQRAPLVGPRANITVSGGSVTGMTLLDNGVGVAAGGQLNASVPFGGTGSGFVVTITSVTQGTGSYNVALGDSAMTNQLRGSYNGAYGAHTDVPDTAGSGQVNFHGSLFVKNAYQGTAQSSTPATNAQIGIGTNNPDASAIVDISSTTKGLKIPVMTAAQASAIASPADGLLLGVSTTNGTFTAVGLWFRINGSWMQL